MAGYLLNLTVKMPTSATNADALFNANSVDRTSRMWYQVPSNWPGSPYDPNSPVSQPAPVTTWPQTAPYPVLDDANINCILGDDVYMRIAPDASWPKSKSGNNLLIGFNAVFGRPATSDHGGATMATPFVIPKWAGPGNNSPLTMFSGPVAVPTSTDGSSIYYLGKAAQNVVGGIERGHGGNQPTCNYSFIVAAYLAYPNVEGWSFGHDPKIIVGPSNR